MNPIVVVVGTGWMGGWCTSVMVGVMGVGGETMAERERGVEGGETDSLRS